MRSHLTRSVFRRILANKPLGHTYCQRTTRQWVQHSVISAHWAGQRRSFWGLLTKEPDDEYFPSEYQRHLEPGMEVMEDLAEALQQQTRPPDTKRLVAGFNQFRIAAMKSKNSKSTFRFRITEYYARHMLSTFEYLLEQKGADQRLEDLGVDCLSTLHFLGENEVDPESNAAVAELSSRIFQVMMKPDPKDEANAGTEAGLVQPIPAELYISILALSGKSEAALAFIDRWNSGQILLYPARLLLRIIRGLATEGKEELAMRTIESRFAGGQKWLDLSEADLRKLHYDLLIHSADKNYAYLTRQLATLLKKIPGTLPRKVLRALLAFSIRTDDLGWGREWFQSLVADIKENQTHDATDEDWKCILLWAAANGQGSEDIERLVAGILNETKRKSVRSPSIACVNELIAFANAKSNAFAAERYLAMGLRWGLSPDGETFLRQMEGRLQAGDVEGAIACYKELEMKEQVSDEKDLPGLNRLLRALCSSKTADYNFLLTILDKLLARKSSLHPETVAALCELFITRGELGEATDLLKRARLDLYSKRQRELISKALFRLVVERKLKTMQMWQAYDLLVKAFPELSVQDRTTIMNAFFERDQSDMASMVFGHMRQSQDPKKRPTADTYIECFEGICKSPDEDSLQLVHNMLKLDTHVDLSTKMLNGLMLAYMTSESPQRSLEYWDEILNSQEGPTYNSIVIVLAACERAMGGNRVARVIMQRLASLEVDISAAIYAAYLGVLSGHAEHHLAMELVGKMQADVGLSPDLLAIGNIYNAVKWNPGSRNEIAGWAKTNYPEIWEELVNIGRYEPNMMGLRDFKINRIPRA